MVFSIAGRLHSEVWPFVVLIQEDFDQRSLDDKYYSSSRLQC